MRSEGRSVDWFDKVLQVAGLDDGQVIPITRWAGGDEDDASVFVCGPDATGRWYVVDTDYFTGVIN